MVTMPLPMSMLTDFCIWPRRHPERAVKAFATHRPTVVVKAGLMEEERTMSGLLPVARMASPSRVLRKSVKISAVARAARAAVTREALPARGVPSSISLARTKTVSVLFRFSKDLPPITQMLME